MKKGLLIALLCSICPMIFGMERRETTTTTTTSSLSAQDRNIDLSKKLLPLLKSIKLTANNILAINDTYLDKQHNPQIPLMPIDDEEHYKPIISPRLEHAFQLAPDTRFQDYFQTVANTAYFLPNTTAITDAYARIKNTKKYEDTVYELAHSDNADVKKLGIILSGAHLTEQIRTEANDLEKIIKPITTLSHNALVDDVTKIISLIMSSFKKEELELKFDYIPLHKDDYFTDRVITTITKAIELAQKNILGSKTPFMYAHRVEKWFNPSAVSTHLPKDIIYHRYPKLIDAYTYCYGFKMALQGGYGIYGEIIFDDGAHWYVEYQMTIGRNDEIYHRGIIKKTFDEIRKEYTHDFADAEQAWKMLTLTENFPALGSESSKSKKAEKLPDGIIQEDKYRVTIRDNFLDANFIVYKPFQE